MTATDANEAALFKEHFDRFVSNVERAVRDKHQAIQLATICLIAEGHLLLEDVPGTGKTSLARAMAQSAGVRSSRVQFTPDLLPSDITGVSIFDPSGRTFVFHPGPVFANVVLADEINRATAKTQSALLEVMEETQVTVDGVTRPLQRPFMVIATQNPIEHTGTYDLPEAQLDRFAVRTHLGPPSHAATVDLLSATRTRSEAIVLPAVLSAEIITRMVQVAAAVRVEREVLGYLVRLAESTRKRADVRFGVSTRGCIALIRLAKALAASRGRAHVTPDDVRELVIPAWAHRLVLASDALGEDRTAEDILVKVLSEVPVQGTR